MNERERRSSEILQQVRPILQEGNPLDVEDGAEAEQDFNMYVLWTHGFLLGGASDDELLNHLSVMGRMDRKPREKQALVAVVERLRAIDVTLPPDDTPTIERETIQAAFRFLSAYQFAEAAPDPAYAWIRVTFSAPRLRVDASYNWRDGFDCAVTFLDHGGSRVYIGILIGALKPDEGSRTQSARDLLEEEAQWLERHIQEVLDAPASVAEDCAALQFWHVGHWRKTWGSTIPMDADRIETERLRLARLREYFGVVYGRRPGLLS